MSARRLHKWLQLDLEHERICVQEKFRRVVLSCVVFSHINESVHSYYGLSDPLASMSERLFCLTTHGTGRALVFVIRRR